MGVDVNNRDFWNAIFARPDPWSYGDLYEKTKRAHTLEVLPRVRFARVLEIGCAEGHFTETLSQIAERLLAIDISTTALSRAQIRCQSLNNICFKNMDVFETFPVGTYDLIVCAEILYYVKNRLSLKTLMRRISSGLHVGGYLLLTHPNSIADNRDQTGFDFHEIGAEYIGHTVAQTPHLRLVRELRTDLYRVQLFKRIDGVASRDQPKNVIVRRATLGENDRARGLVKWGGCKTTDAEARHLWRSLEISILMYHRIADAGPAELAPYRVTPQEFEYQLAYLQCQGYQSVTIGDAFNLLQAKGHPPRGRLIVFTFDDAYKDFFDCAWPLLKKYGFLATVFVPVSFVGGYAEWDRAYGEPAPLMSWNEIKSAQSEGVVFGSHSVSHRHLGRLSDEDVSQELSVSKYILETELGTPQTVFCYPFGDINDGVRHAVETCGYSHAVVGVGNLRREDDRYRMPRQEVLGHYGMDQFVRLLGAEQRSDVFTRLKYRWRRICRDRRTYMDF